MGVLDSTATSNIYELSPFWSEETTRLGELKEFRQQGTTFIKSQRAYMDYDKALDLIAGMSDTGRIPKSLSRVKNNQVKRDVREIVGSISNMKPTWQFQAGDKERDRFVHTLNKRQQFWYYQTFADRQIRQAYQFAGVLGTGWISPRWKRDNWGFGKGDISLKVMSPREVLPVQLPPDNNLQDSYIVTLIEETPINMARCMFPLKQEYIVPDRDSPSAMMKATNAVLQFLSPALNVSGSLRGKERQHVSWPTVDLHYTYIRDTTVNTTGKEMHFDFGTSWGYKVPYLDQQIPDGTYDKSTGVPKTRAAEAEDCLLYPNRRLVVWTNYGILRDGPNYDIHGMVPAVPFKFDDWPWEFLGFSLLRDTAPLHMSATRLLRAIDDSQNAKLRPPIAWDDGLISENLASRLDPRQPGIQIPASLQMGKPFELLIPPAYYQQDASLFAHVKDLYQWGKQLMGLQDMTALMKARQVPASDSIEKFLEMAGPIVTDMTRNSEGSMVQVADIWKGLAIQHYSTKDRLQTLGDDGATQEDIDYEPGTMIPSHMSGENPNHPSAFTQVQRSKHTMDSITTYVNPQSVHEMTNVSKRMSLILLKKAGVKIDTWTMAKAFSLDNYGPEPEGTTNMVERWLAEQHMDRELAAELQGATGGGQPGPGRGRPNSGNRPPHPVSKDNGTRVVNSTS